MQVKNIRYVHIIEMFGYTMGVINYLLILAIILEGAELSLQIQKPGICTHFTIDHCELKKI